MWQYILLSAVGTDIKISLVFCSVFDFLSPLPFLDPKTILTHLLSRTC